MKREPPRLQLLYLCLNNPLKYADPTGYSDISSIIRQLWDYPYGGYWNAGDANPTKFHSSLEALNYVSTNIDQLTSGGTTKVQRQIVIIYDKQQKAYYYDENNGQVWDFSMLEFVDAGTVLPGITYDSNGDFYMYFLPAVDIAGKRVGHSRGWFKDLMESVINYMGYSTSVVENGMKASVITLDEFKNTLITQGASTEMINKILTRDASLGGIARIGGQLIFYGQLGYNLYDIGNNPTFANIALRSSDTFFNGVATYGGWPGLGIAGIYYLNKESIIISIKSLEQGLIKSNPNATQNYIGGLGITPFIYHW